MGAFPQFLLLVLTIMFCFRGVELTIKVLDDLLMRLVESLFLLI